MSEKEATISDQILDLLLAALQERQQAREVETAVPTVPVTAEIKPEATIETAAPAPERPAPTPAGEPALDTEPAVPQPLASINLERMLSRLFLALALLIIIVNIPFNRYGTSLARAMPDSAALVIRDGLLLKGSGDEVYVLENNKRRWITTLDAFAWYGYRWGQVHEVDDEFLDAFEAGLPIHLLLKCHSSPHVYALEGGEKRWIKDIPTFEARQYRWDDIKFVSCDYLRELPDGPPIPEDAGPPPQP